MISELVAGSACTWPPVDGRAEAATGVVDCAEAPPAVPDVPVGAFGFCVAVVRPSAVGAPPVPPAGPPPPLPALPRRDRGAQQLGHLHGVGVLQVDDPDVAGRAAAGAWAGRACR